MFPPRIEKMRWGVTSERNKVNVPHLHRIFSRHPRNLSNAYTQLLLNVRDLRIRTPIVPKCWRHILWRQENHVRNNVLFIIDRTK